MPTLLKDVHPDMERYLANDCYCCNEIYDTSGFFFDLFFADTECEIVTQTDDASVVIACGSHNPNSPQCIYFWHDDDTNHIVAAQRVDATPNNIGILKDIAHGVKPDGRKLDEFEPGYKTKSVKQVLDMADMIMIS